MMFVEIDCFVGNNTLVDPDVYQLWLDGYTAQEAALRIHQNSTFKYSDFSIDHLVSDILDHYRTFQMLEKWLQHPSRLSEQLIFQITPQTQKLIIQKYYEFDNTVIREFLGKKLSSRNRKDLDEVSEKSGVSIKSCRRQFDNVKRIYKSVEELTGSLVQNIQSHFLLPEKLAKKYAQLAYITNNRFETGKRKLHYLELSDFLFCANEIMSNWSCSNADCKYEESCMDMDREFLQELREMKILVEKEFIDEQKAKVMSNVKNKISDRTYIDVESNFRSISRILVNIAYGLNHSKEVKDFFIDLVEKIIDPCRHAKWTAAELQIFLEAYSETARHMEPFKIQLHLLSVWIRYMRTVTSCILQMYHS